MQQEKRLFHQLAEPLLEGFAWGLGAQQSEPPYPIEVLETFARQHLSAELTRDLSELNTRAPEPDFIDAVDAFVDQHPAIEDLREFLIDLAVLQVIVGASEREDDFLESPSWLAMEQKTEERGTELLNLLVYFKDCAENETKATLEDFLHEFLLVDEDDFQEEMAIYESIVRNELLVREHSDEIIKVGNDQTGEMQELFTPTMLFFKLAEPRPGKIMASLLAGSNLPQVHAALYQLLVHAPRFIEA